MRQQVTLLMGASIMVAAFAVSCGQGDVWLPEGANTDENRLTQLSDEECARYGLGPGCFIDDLSGTDPNIYISEPGSGASAQQPLSSEEESSSSEELSSELPASSEIGISSEIPTSSETGASSQIQLSSSVGLSSVVTPSSSSVVTPSSSSVALSSSVQSSSSVTPSSSSTTGGCSAPDWSASMSFTGSFGGTACSGTIVKGTDGNCYGCVYASWCSNAAYSPPPNANGAWESCP